VKGHAAWSYLALLLGKPGQPDYDVPPVGSGILFSLNMLGLCLFPALAWIFFRMKRRMEFLGVSWTFITLLPALLFPLVTYMADRYLYAPSIGFAWMLAAVAVELGRLDRFSRRAARGYAALAAVLGVAVVFTLGTLRYSKVWKSSDTLWTFALTKSKDYRIYNNLADVRMRQQRWAEAERLLRKGTEVENITSYQSLGVLYHETNRLDEAIAATDQAIRILAKEKKPIPSLSAELHFNRGGTFYKKGDVATAIAEWRFALREDPTHAQAREWLGIATNGKEGGGGTAGPSGDAGVLTGPAGVSRGPAQRSDVKTAR
jgi:tetratricopeptide (TPR) repeat protein